MRMRRYHVRECVLIDAPVERVYAVASDPEAVPVYAPEVVRIEVRERLGDGAARVTSHLRIGKLTFAWAYRYNYRPPTHYSGVQERGALLRGYFSFTFRPRGGRTEACHSEGLLSPVPLLARALGLLYFRVIARGGVREELDRLKRLVESESEQGSAAGGKL